MLVLFETAGGYALFKVKDKVLKSENISAMLESEDSITLSGFKKFGDTTEALAAAAALIEGKMDKQLKSFLRTSIISKDIKDQLAVADPKIGKAINGKLDIPCVHNDAVNEIMRVVRSRLDSLLPGVRKEDSAAMSLGLAHSLSRYKLKFSPDKVDTMIVQAIGLLDDLDKELNTYCMRVREWYGWHFPELNKIVADHVAYARMVNTMGFRTNAKTTDLSEILPEEIEQEVKEAAEISMGTEISDKDLHNIKYLCTEVISISAYRAELYDYLRNRMNAIAPNLTIMVGEQVGARLIAHAGSLLNLAKHPASTVQILGAEKALFRALKTKHDTPKYGFLYNASVVGQSAAKNKGKMSRVLAAKTSLVARVDALADEQNTTIGLEYKLKVDARLRQLEGDQAHKQVRSSGAEGKAAYKPPSEAVPQYNAAADSTLSKMDVDSSPKSDKKKKKKKKKTDDDEDKPSKKRKAAIDDEGPDDDGEIKKKKKKKKKSSDE